LLVYLKLKFYRIFNIIIGSNSLNKNKNNCTKKSLDKNYQKVKFTK